jgi:hypothetical protein
MQRMIPFSYSSAWRSKNNNKRGYRAHLYQDIERGYIVFHHKKASKICSLKYFSYKGDLVTE